MKTIRTTDELRGGTNPFPSVLQSAEDERREELNECHCNDDFRCDPCMAHESDSFADSYYSLRDDGRNPDGSGESYAERNQ